MKEPTAEKRKEITQRLINGKLLALSMKIS